MLFSYFYSTIPPYFKPTHHNSKHVPQILPVDKGLRALYQRNCKAEIQLQSKYKKELQENTYKEVNEAHT